MLYSRNSGKWWSPSSGNMSPLHTEMPPTQLRPVMALGGAPLCDSARYGGSLECDFQNNPCFTFHLYDCACCSGWPDFNCEANSRIGMEFPLSPDHASFVRVALCCHMLPFFPSSRPVLQMAAWLEPRKEKSGSIRLRENAQRVQWTQGSGLKRKWLVSWETVIASSVE